jgi:hypothetical protein
MIRQYLPNNNENATVPILQKNLHLNRAMIELDRKIFFPPLLQVRGGGQCVTAAKYSAKCSLTLWPGLDT